MVCVSLRILLIPLILTGYKSHLVSLLGLVGIYCPQILKFYFCAIKKSNGFLMGDPPCLLTSLVLLTA